MSEALSRNLAHRNSVSVHFKSVLFYYFYEPDPENPCICTTESWCLPYWFRALTNKTVDIWLVGRDSERTVYKMDDNGCLMSLKQGLKERTLLTVTEIDVMFVFEVRPRLWLDFVLGSDGVWLRINSKMKEGLIRTLSLTVNFSKT